MKKIFVIVITAFILTSVLTILFNFSMAYRFKEFGGEDDNFILRDFIILTAFSSLLFSVFYQSLLYLKRDLVNIPQIGVFIILKCS